MNPIQIDWSITPAAIWRQRRELLRPVFETDPIRLADLQGVDRQKEALVRNTERFLAGRPANNALLWGARGTGKSSLIKALLNEYVDQGLRVVEVDKNDLVWLPEIIDEIRESDKRFIIYSDDLSFERGESTYKALKSVIEGSIERPPANVIIYATSNRRHLMPESMEDNERARVVQTEIHHAEAVEEQISLSDRFGLWLSFYPFNQDEYLRIVDGYFPDYAGDRAQLHRMAIQFALAKGGRSGRAALQFYRSYAE